jgi:hypothetical protein
VRTAAASLCHDDFPGGDPAPTRLPRCSASRDVRLSSRRCPFDAGAPAVLTPSLSFYRARGTGPRSLIGEVVEPSSLGIGRNTLAFPREEGALGPMLGVTGSTGEALEALVTLARDMLSAVDEGRPTGDLVRAMGLATLATIPPGESLWLRAAEVLEAPPAPESGRAARWRGHRGPVRPAQRGAGSNTRRRCVCWRRDDSERPQALKIAAWDCKPPCGSPSPFHS